MKSPAITVLMPVYNGRAYLSESINSILNQTFTDFELLIINDGSTDDSASLVQQFQDSRILLHHQQNVGLAATLNKGIQLAKGRYIARQDQDDIALPLRLEKQFAYMEQHKQCALLGTAANIWVDDQPTDREHRHPLTHVHLIFELMFNNPFVHSSVMLRRAIFNSISGYTTDPFRQPPEDFELWSRIARHYQIANLPECLLIYREVKNSMSRAVANPFIDKLVTICAENISAVSGIKQNDVIHNIAALTHSAYHQLKKPNFQKMQYVLRQAGKNLALTWHAPDLIDKTNERINNLHHQFLQYKLNKFHLQKAIAPLYRLYKCIMKK